MKMPSALRTARLFFLCCSIAAGTQAWSAQAPAVVLTQGQLQAVLASGRSTPLDAFTPYGKRRFIRALSWGQNGLGGLSTVSLVRELNAGELTAVLAFFESSAYLPMLRKELDGAPLRLPAPDPDVERDLERLEDILPAGSADAGEGETHLQSQPLLPYYIALFGARMEEAALRKAPAAKPAASVRRGRTGQLQPSRHARLSPYDASASGDGRARN